MQNSPALKLLIPLIIGIVLTRFCRCCSIYVLVASIVLTLLLFVSYFRSQPGLFALIVALQFTAIGYLFTVHQLQKLSQQTLTGFCRGDEWLGVEGTILSPIEYGQERQMFTLNVDTVWADERPFEISGKARATLYGKAVPLRYGDRIVCKGQLRSPPPARNPGEFDYRRYLQAKGITALITIPDHNHLMIMNRNEGALLLQRLVYPVRRYIRHSVNRFVQGQARPLLLGLLLGSKSEIDPAVKADFSNSGVIHVLAVSGLHVGFIVAALFLLLTLVRLPQPWCNLVVILGLFFYVHLTGCKAPVMRASVMASILLIGRVLQRPVDILNALSIAALIILLINPLDLFQVGFQLSFAAVLGILLIYNRFELLFRAKFQKWREKENQLNLYVGGLFLVSISAQLATLPLTAFYFNKIPLISLLANLVVVPAVGIVVALGYISALMHLISPFIAEVYASANACLLDALISLIHYSGRLPFAYLEVATPSFIDVLVYTLLLSLFIFFQHQKVRKALIVALLFVLNIAVYKSLILDKPGLHIHVLDVGQGDSILLQFPNHQNCLIDAGDCNKYIDYGDRVVRPFLQREGIDHLDAVIISHPHSDHIGGMPSVLRHCNVKRLIRTGVHYDSPFCDAVDSLALARNIPCRHIAAGDTLFFDPNLLCLVLHPTPAFIGNATDAPEILNNASIVMAFYYGDRAFLFTGDAEIAAEQQLLRYDSLLKSDFLKIGHHGSITASSAPFIDRIAPRYAVVSVGAFNRFGLPSRKRMAMLDDKGIEVIRTDINGAVQFFSDGSRLVRKR